MIIIIISIVEFAVTRGCGLVEGHYMFVATVKSCLKIPLNIKLKQHASVSVIFENTFLPRAYARTEIDLLDLSI